MPIVKVSAPLESLAVFQQKHGKPKRTLAETKPDEVHTHGVFHAKPEDLAAGLGLTKAELVSWQFHVHNDHRAPVAHEVKVPATGYNTVHTYQEMSHGQHVEDIKTILDKLETDQPKELGQENYELCILRMPSLKIIAVWLRASRRELDWFVPIPPSFYGLKAMEMIDSAHFLKTAQLVAQKFLARPAVDDDDMMGG